MTTKLSNYNFSDTFLSNVNNPRILSLTIPGGQTYFDAAGGQSITITGKYFVSGTVVRIGRTLATSVSFNNTNSISFTTPSLTAGSYTLAVINPDGGTAQYPKYITVQ